MTSTRKTIARRLTEAWTAPVFQLGVSIDMTEALHLREQLVARLGEGDVKPTVNDLLTRFVGVALVRHRAVNATFDGRADPPPSQAHTSGWPLPPRTGSSCPSSATPTGAACRRSPAPAPISSVAPGTAS